MAGCVGRGVASSWQRETQAGGGAGREPRPVGGATAWRRPPSGSSVPPSRCPTSKATRPLAKPSPTKGGFTVSVAGGELTREGRPGAGVGPWPQRVEGELRRAERRRKARETSGGGAGA